MGSHTSRTSSLLGAKSAGSAIDVRNKLKYWRVELVLHACLLRLVCTCPEFREFLFYFACFFCLFFSCLSVDRPDSVRSEDRDQIQVKHSKCSNWSWKCLVIVPRTVFWVRCWLFALQNLWAEISFCVLSLVGAALWVDVFFISYLTDEILTFTSHQSLIKFCKRDDAQVRHWASIYEEAFGTKISELVQDWRSHPSPPEQHQYPSHAQPQQTQQQQEQDQQLFHNNVHPHMHMHVQHQLANRRLSNTNSQISIGLGSNSRSPNKHGEPSSSYTNGSANVTSNNNLSHKSASNVTPTSYPLGRPVNSINSSNNRTMGMNPQSSNGFSDPSSTSNSNRDSRISLTTQGVVVGQMMGHSGNGNDCLNPSLLGKYVDKESNAQAVNPLSRWPLLAGDSSGVGGGAGDSGMQQNGVGQVLTGGSGNGSGGNGSGNVNTPRNLALGDGAQSLPSLKDSGLLDSWGSSRAAAVDTPKQTSNESPQQQQPKQQQPLTTPPKTTTLGSSIAMALPSTAQHYAPAHNQDVPDLRPTTLGMPVGMSWLANESR